jgi:hypothetical protein
MVPVHRPLLPVLKLGHQLENWFCWIRFMDWGPSLRTGSVCESGITAIQKRSVCWWINSCGSQISNLKWESQQMSPDHRLMIDLSSKFWPNFSGHSGTEGRPKFRGPESKASLCHLLWSKILSHCPRRPPAARPSHTRLTQDTTPPPPLAFRLPPITALSATLPLTN